MSCERCERDIERLRRELNILRSEMIEVVGGMLARVDEVLATVETSHRQMFAAAHSLMAPSQITRSKNQRAFPDVGRSRHRIRSASSGAS